MTHLRVISACFVALSLFGCATPSAVVKLKEPETESYCAASGGEWSQDFFKNFFCAMRTTDVAKLVPVPSNVSLRVSAQRMLQTV
jgi:hypothetical protein